MSVRGVTRATVIALALTVAGVPVARRLCTLTCEAIPAPAETAGVAHRSHCAAHPPPSESQDPESRQNPCGHGHGGDGALLTSFAGIAKAGARSFEVSAALLITVSDPARGGPRVWQTDVDRRLAMPPPAARHPILRL